MQCSDCLFYKNPLFLLTSCLLVQKPCQVLYFMLTKFVFNDIIKWYMISYMEKRWRNEKKIL